MKTVLGIFCKHPLPGNVKTRLAATIGNEPAARLYEAFLRDLVGRLRSAADMVLLCYTPDNEQTERYVSSLAGAGIGVVPQAQGDLGQRLALFFDHAKQTPPLLLRPRWYDWQLKRLKRRLKSDVRPLRQIVIGSDCPTITRTRIRQAHAALNTHDAVLGRSDDGGYYLIGLNRTVDGLFDDIDWSTPLVFEQQRDRLESAGFTVKELEPIPEVDTIEDLHQLLKHPMLSECEHTCRVLEELKLR